MIGDSNKFIEDPQIFFGDPQILIGDPHIFIGDPLILIGDPNIFIGTLSCANEHPNPYSEQICDLFRCHSSNPTVFDVEEQGSWWFSPPPSLTYISVLYNNTTVSPAAIDMEFYRNA